MTSRRRIQTPLFSFKPEAPYEAYRQATVRYITQGGHKARRVHLTQGDNLKAIKFSYARYLYQVWYWSEHQALLPEGYDVAHRDDNTLNDDLANLELIPKRDLMRRVGHRRGNQMILLRCAHCEKRYLKRTTEVLKAWSKIQHALCCSPHCARTHQQTVVDYPSDLLDQVRAEQVLYEVRTHHFEYNPYFSDLYPHTEILRSYREHFVLDAGGTAAPCHRLGQTISDIKVAIADGASPVDIAKTSERSRTWVQNVILKYGLVPDQRYTP